MPRDMQPATLATSSTTTTTCSSPDTLASTPVLHEVADSILHPDLPLGGRPLSDAVTLATAGCSPPRWREVLGLPWGPNRERLLDASAFRAARALPLLPGVVREFPGARSADRRVRTAA